MTTPQWIENPTNFTREVSVPAFGSFARLFRDHRGDIALDGIGTPMTIEQATQLHQALGMFLEHLPSPRR